MRREKLAPMRNLMRSISRCYYICSQNGFEIASRSCQVPSETEDGSVVFPYSGGVLKGEGEKVGNVLYSYLGRMVTKYRAKASFYS